MSVFDWNYLYGGWSGLVEGGVFPGSLSEGCGMGG